ncbi:MAG: GntR family transcriptional regulator [Desulfobacteraceae bacterium]|jgi:DNA-binding GntR family transcriptional regulator
MKGVLPISRTKSLKEKAYDILKELILTGRLEQGKLHNEKRLAEVLGVSRTPVREALLELSREGMVSFVPSKGVKVLKITPKQVQEVFELRRIIEGYIIKSISKQLTPADLKKIEKILNKQDRSASKEEELSFIEMDKEFHLFMASKMGNQQIETILQNLRDQIHLMGIRAIKDQSRSQQVLKEHQSIFSALKKKDAKRAHEELMKHLNNTEKILIDILAREQGR